MQIEEHQLESVATSSGIVGTDDTTLTERVELSSCGVACDRLLVHLNKSKLLHVWRYPDSAQKFLMFQ